MGFHSLGLALRSVLILLSFFTVSSERLSLENEEIAATVTGTVETTTTDAFAETEETVEKMTMMPVDDIGGADYVGNEGVKKDHNGSEVGESFDSSCAAADSTELGGTCTAVTVSKPTDLTKNPLYSEIQSTIESVHNLELLQKERIELTSSLRADTSQLLERRQKLLERFEELNDLIRQHNSVQLGILANRLNDTLREEQLRRKTIAEIEQQFLAEQEAAAEAKEKEKELDENVDREDDEEGEGRDEEHEQEEDRRVLLMDLEKAFDIKNRADHILAKSEMKIQDALASITSEEVIANGKFLSTTEKGEDDGIGCSPVDKLADMLLQEEEKTVDESLLCVTEEEATDMVSSAILSHVANTTGIAAFDHALLSSGSSVVYANDMTSESFTIPRSDDDAVVIVTNGLKDLRMAFVTAWGYVKTAYEYPGEAFDAFMEVAPSNVDEMKKVMDDFLKIRKAGVMNMVQRWNGFREKRLMSGSQSQRFSVKLNSAAEVFSPSTKLGDCWPMNGPTGRITVRLASNVKISSVTVEHVSPLLELGVYDGSVGSSISAPRYIRVIGYPPCNQDSEKSGFSDGDYNDGEESDEKHRACKVLGFDVSEPVDLGHFEYLRPSAIPGEDGANVRQTFDIQVSEEGEEELEMNDEADHYDDYDDGESIYVDEQEEVIFLDDEEEDAGSCSSMTACTAPSPLEKDDEQRQKENFVLKDKRDRSVVRAVTLIVDENWGNRDYTCLYRFSVQGDIPDFI